MQIYNNFIIDHFRKFQKNNSGSILSVWFFVFFGLFILSMSYFFIYPAIHETLDAVAHASCIEGCSPEGTLIPASASDATRQAWYIDFNNRLDTNWRFAHIMIGVGLILYGLLRSIRREFHTYSKQY